ncbi:hypothetical protein MHH33_17365 [Paenisporosarcina sp. FSL H8-0542]|uniref:hypothetical protein n=1 Tax=Paenisporosarcina sp. FSL H8-0542 TaxID=2921401 RepID=UPI00315AC41B
MRKAMGIMLIGGLLITGCSEKVKSSENEKSDPITEQEYVGKFENNYDLIHENLNKISAASASSSLDDMEELCKAFSHTTNINLQVMSEVTPPKEYQEANEMLIVALENYIDWGWAMVELLDDPSDEVGAKVDHHLGIASENLEKAHAEVESLK